MWIVKAALKNSYAVVVFALMILVLGALAIWNIPVDILPVFKAPAVQVLTYFQGMPASGKTATWSEIHIVRFENGKAIEHWGVVDQMGMLSQLGFVEAPGQPAGAAR